MDPAEQAAAPRGLPHQSPYAPYYESIEQENPHILRYPLSQQEEEFILVRLQRGCRRCPPLHLDVGTLAAKAASQTISLYQALILPVRDRCVQARYSQSCSLERIPSDELVHAGEQLLWV